MADLPPAPDRESTATPLWVKVFGTIALVLILLLVIMLIAGGNHGPGRHVPPGSAIEYGLQQP